MAKLSESYNHFSFNLFKKIGSGHAENLFYSPYSIVSALAMCIAGARKNTEKQLKQVLHFDKLSNDDLHHGNAELQQHLGGLGEHVALNVANRLFQRHNYEVKKEYLDLLRKFYNSEAHGLDFSKPAVSANTINDWVSAQTNNKIQKLVPESLITPMTQLILVNAIYFRGNWDMKFNKDSTHPEAFFLPDKTEKQVQMMTITGKKFNYIPEVPGLKASACRLPYAGKQLSMTIVLPHEGVNISQIEAKLDGKTLHNALSFDRNVKVNVFVPKFKFEQQFELADVLSKMGAPDAFDEKKADFSGIKNPDDGLHISNVIHKAIVEVNEEGTEAAAATAVVMMTRCAVLEFPEEFKCNRPFMFFIHENKHNTVLFAGRYSRPE